MPSLKQIHSTEDLRSFGEYLLIPYPPNPKVSLCGMTVRPDGKHPILDVYPFPSKEERVSLGGWATLFELKDSVLTVSWGPDGPEESYMVYRIER